MKTSSIILLVLVVALVIVGGWWWYMDSSAQNQYATGPATYVPTSTAPTASTASNAPMVLNVGVDPSLGNYLTATNGMTLYKYDQDTPNSGVSTCTGECATVWPPYTVASTSSIAGFSIPGATGTIGTITRKDGTVQVTYNGYPLYFYAKDSNPGDTTGENVGGVWFIVTP